MDTNNEAVEKIVIGCMIQDENCSNRCLEVNGSYFSNNELRNIYDSIVKLQEQNKTVDMWQLAVCKVNVELMQECFYSAPSTASFDSNFEHLKAIYNKNNIISQVLSLYEDLKNSEYETTEQLAEKVVDCIQLEKTTTSKAQSLKDIYKDLKEEYEFFDKQKPMNWGMLELDKYTQGIYNGELTVIAARPGKGKTALAIQAAINLSKQGFKGLIFSREMLGTQLIRRIISNTFNMNSYKLKRSKNMKDHEKKRIEEEREKFLNLPIKIDSKSETIEKIKIMCKYYKKMNQLDYVVIDYLQLIETSKSFNNREQEVSYISRQLKLLTLELGIPIILLAQLNRGPEQRQDKRPVLSDLRESGAIEQDANNVFMLYQTEEMDNEEKLDILIVKQREGVLKDITMFYRKKVHLITDTCPF